MKTLKSKKGDIQIPAMTPILVPIDKVRANNYNPNSVPRNNMELLEQSIIDNGFCFPVVVVWDPEDEVYVIVDGFHRYTIMKDYLGCQELPVVVLEQDISQRMCSTIQFNRARGVHQVDLVADMVKSLSETKTDEEIAQHLGMEEEEVFRLKQITGIAALFKDSTYSQSWEMEEIEGIDEEGE